MMIRPQYIQSRAQPRPVSGPFGLDPDVMAAIEDGMEQEMQALSRKPVLRVMDLSFLDEPVRAPSGPPTGSHLPR